MIAIGASLDIRVLAEGIETTEEADALPQFGRGFGQGCCFGRPVPAIGFSMAQREAALSA